MVKIHDSWFSLHHHWEVWRARKMLKVAGRAADSFLKVLSKLLKYIYSWSWVWCHSFASFVLLLWLARLYHHSVRHHFSFCSFLLIHKHPPWIGLEHVTSWQSGCHEQRITEIEKKHRVVSHLHCTSRNVLALIVTFNPLSTEHEYIPELFLRAVNLSVPPVATVLPSFIQIIFGTGLPVAMQWNVTSSDSFTVLLTALTVKLGGTNKKQSWSFH